jgi:hypothetical protein
MGIILTMIIVWVDNYKKIDANIMNRFRGKMKEKL